MIDKLVGCLLAPWQKIEMLRTYIIPSILYCLASGYCRKDYLTSLDANINNALRRILDLPDTCSTAFFHASRSVGGLAVPLLSRESDVWVIARAVRLLCSDDPSICDIAHGQVAAVLTSAGIDPSTFNKNAYLSGSQHNQMAALRHSPSLLTLWSRARSASARLGVTVDLSTQPCISVDEITATPAGMVRGLHMAIRARYSKSFANQSQQGIVAKASSHDGASRSDIARIISTRTPLSFNSYNLFFMSRLSLLPSHGRAGAKGVTKCRSCSFSHETTAHIVAGCQSHMTIVRQRHNNIIDLLKSHLRQGFSVTEEPIIAGLKPDLLIEDPDGQLAVVEVTCPWDGNIDVAFNTKEEQ